MRLEFHPGSVMASETLNIIYDGQCTFCTRTLSVFRRLDFKRRLRFYDWHEAETRAEFPALRGADGEAMYVIAENESPYRGFFAFRRLIWNSPATWALVPLFYFPGASLLGPAVYAWVARNRRSLGCGSEVCALPEATQSVKPRG